METTVKPYTTESVLSNLGYADPLVAARQQARMILLGRRSRYQATIQQLEAQWRCSLDEMRARYLADGTEDFAVDDDYLQWQWFTDALDVVTDQLNAITA
jgi:hypothetical protein